MIKYIILAIVCIIALIIFIFTTKRVKQYKKDITALSSLYDQKKTDLEKIENQYIEYEKACTVELDRKERAQNDANLIENYNQKMRDQADESAQNYYNQTMELTKTKLETALEQEAQSYRDAKAEYEQEYTQAMSDMAAAAADYGKTARQLLASIQDLQSKQRAAIEAQKRLAEQKEKLDFYRIQIPESDLLEIEKLREVLPYLRDKDALNKVIYKIYYENPTNDLIGRVIGKKQGGIYKITNINNGKCYVGQAVSFSNRWKQHIKRGVGAEAPTHNKLYPAMLKDGVENFTFEVIEECPINKLNEREDYWQEFFGAKEYGYSIK